MRPNRSTQLGLVLIASAVILGFVRFAFPYLWGAVSPGIPASSSLGLQLRTLWIPLSADLIAVAIAAVGGVGFLFLWRGRWDFGPAYASRVGLSVLALAIGGVLLAVWFASGLLLGFVSGLTYLVPWRHLILFVASVFVSFALYWALANLPLAGIRPLAAVAFALGVAGSGLLFLSTFNLHRTSVVTLRGASDALSLVSLALWLALCLWGWGATRSGRLGPAATATQSA